MNTSLLQKSVNIKLEFTFFKTFTEFCRMSVLSKFITMTFTDIFNFMVDAVLSELISSDLSLKCRQKNVVHCSSTCIADVTIQSQIKG